MKDIIYLNDAIWTSNMLLILCPNIKNPTEAHIDHIAHR